MFDAILSNHKIKNIHFIGIGGIGMSSIATLMNKLGWVVTGSDLNNNNHNIQELLKLGIKVYSEHSAANIKPDQYIVFSSAIKKSNVEIVRASELSLKIFKRAEILAGLMNMKSGIAVAGTHGKTTTTSLLATIMSESSMSPSYSVGGIVKNLGGHADIGEGKHFIAEVDESDGSFLEFRPNNATITNIDTDHLDFYKSEDNLHKAFLDFARNIDSDGALTINGHDKELVKLAGNLNIKVLTFGLEASFDLCAKNIKSSRRMTCYDLYYKGEFKTSIKIQLVGEHNVLNSLSAISMAFLSDVNFDLIAKSIFKFVNVKRRIELLFEEEQFEVIDDYAHHPTEIRLTLKTLKKVNPDKKLVCIFQPHRYSRTRECWEEYLSCFNYCDHLYLTPIYAASEDKVEGVNSIILAEDISKLKKIEKVASLNELQDVSRVLENYRASNTLIVTMGAGSISSTVRQWTDIQRN